jgi:CspA family cold shock protein
MTRDFAELYDGAAEAREVGRVKWFDPERGYGFILRDSGEQIFVHHTQIKAAGYQTLGQGGLVEFGLGIGSKGKLEAKDVTALAKGRTPWN